MSVSDDGRRVAFTSIFSNLASGDTNLAVDAYVYDRVDRVTIRYTRADRAAISPDGRALAVNSPEGLLVGVL